MPLPRVSFVIPCFNHGRFVAEAVRSALGQGGCEPSVVIVDDGSDDGATPGACDACRELDPARVALVHQPNRGLPAARNRGGEDARSRFAPEFLVFLDADDFVRPGFVEKLHAAIAADPDSAAVSHAYCQEELIELGTGIWTVPEWDPLLLMVTNLHPVTALVRASAFERAGGFDATMTDGYEDWDFWLKLASRGLRGVRVREPLFVWRRHSHTTMVMEAVKRHESLYRRLIENHRELFARHAVELLVRTNGLLRKADANWLDENLDAIVIRDLRAWTRDLVRERDDARAAVPAGAAEVERLRVELADARDRARLAEAESARARGDAEAARLVAQRTREHYESKPVIRVSKRLHQFIDRMPAPIASPLRAAARGVKSVVNSSTNPERR